MTTQASMPLKRFGKMDLQISALGLGGHHLGAAKDEETAVAIVHAALDGGITFSTTAGNTTAASQRTGSAKV